MLLSLLLGSCTVLQPVMAAEPACPASAPPVQLIGPLYALGPTTVPEVPRRAPSSRQRRAFDDRGYDYGPRRGYGGWRYDRFRRSAPYADYGYRAPPYQARDRRLSWYARLGGAARDDRQYYAGRVITPYGWGYPAPGIGAAYQLRSY
jgi:hypothetical protein